MILGKLYVFSVKNSILNSLYKSSTKISMKARKIDANSVVHQTNGEFDARIWGKKSARCTYILNNPAHSSLLLALRLPHDKDNTRIKIKRFDDLSPT